MNVLLNNVTNSAHDFSFLRNSKKEYYGDPDLSFDDNMWLQSLAVCIYMFRITAENVEEHSERLANIRSHLSTPLTTDSLTHEERVNNFCLKESVTRKYILTDLRRDYDRWV